MSTFTQPDGAPAADDPIDTILARMSLEGLYQVYDGLGIIFEVSSGLLSQSRYRAAGFLLNDAGEILDRVVGDAIGLVRDKIYAIVEKRPATTDSERMRRFALLADRYVDGISDPAQSRDAIARIVADLGKGGAK